MKVTSHFTALFVLDGVPIYSSTVKRSSRDLTEKGIREIFSCQAYQKVQKAKKQHPKTTVF